jgi:hypothetical protein
MKRDRLIDVGVCILIALQSWLLLEVVSIRERMVKIETNMNWYNYNAKGFGFTHETTHEKPK